MLQNYNGFVINALHKPEKYQDCKLQSQSPSDNCVQSNCNKSGSLVAKF